MSATISDASHRASGSIACRVTVQLVLRLRGDLEFDPAAQRMPIERKHHPPGDLLEGRRGFGSKILIEIQSTPLQFAVRSAVAADHPLGLLLELIWLTAR